MHNRWAFGIDMPFVFWMQAERSDEL